MNPLHYVDRCIHFATVLLTLMFEDKSQRTEPQEWTHEFSHTINIMMQFSSSSQNTGLCLDETKLKIDQFKAKYAEILSAMNKNR